MDDIDKIRESIIDEVFTEDFHKSLTDLEPEVAKQVIESLENDEIYIKVNQRRFQEDYIADYIDYLWDISRDSYWNHIYISIDEEVGLLWNDHMNHFQKMCNNKIPRRILKRILRYHNSIRTEPEKFDKTNLELIRCVLKAQIEKFNRWKDIKSCLKDLKVDDYKQFKKDIKLLIDCKCKYIFYEL